MGGTAKVVVLRSVGGSSALREADADAAKSPSIDITNVDDAVDCHLIPKISDLWPHPANEEEDDDLAEVLRTDLRVAITKVLVEHRVQIVDPEPPV